MIKIYNNDLAQWIWKRLAKCLPMDDHHREELAKLAQSLQVP